MSSGQVKIKSSQTGIVIVSCADILIPPFSFATKAPRHQVIRFNYNLKSEMELAYLGVKLGTAVPICLRFCATTEEQHPSIYRVKLWVF